MCKTQPHPWSPGQIALVEYYTPGGAFLCARHEASSPGREPALFLTHERAVEFLQRCKAEGAVRPEPAYSQIIRRFASAG